MHDDHDRVPSRRGRSVRTPGRCGDAGAPARLRAPLAAADAWVAAAHDTLCAVNQRIWSHPEVGLQETRSAAELVALLERGGFRVERGAAGMPTAFVATAGSGKPIVGILAEYDALPGVSQAAAPAKQPRTTGSQSDAGHACGHSLFGVASTAAALAAWNAAQAAHLPGTIRLYGTPAEETGIGKCFMARAGLFDDLDAVLHWHPGDENKVSFATNKAVVSVKWRFTGLNAHASLSPHRGRSALDGVELMNVGANYLREHVTEDARIHYVITDGGGQPNVVPPSAEVWYYLRADAHHDVEAILDRMRDVARGAGLMSATTVAENIQSESYELLPNRPISELLQRHLERVGAPRFDAAERSFAKQTQAGIDGVPEAPLSETVTPLPASPWHEKASTDVGNVSWSAPTSGIEVTCFTNGAPGHSWQVVACSGMSIGEKGMAVAARTLAGAALEVLADPALVAAARRDFETRRALGHSPRSVLAADQRPPVAIR